MDEQKLETLGLHAGFSHDPHTGSSAPPLYQTAAYQFESPEHAAALFELREPGNIYTRITNPTNEFFEKRMAAIEGGAAALAVSSGMSAILLAVLNVTRSGDHIVSADNLYGGTWQLFKNTLPDMGRTTTFVDSSQPAKMREAITDKTKAIYLENIGNPKLDVPDYEQIVPIAREAGIPIIVDNTLGTGLMRPIEHGADIVILSATKYVGGHGRAVGGVIVESGKTNWDKEKYPMFSKGEPGYHGLVFGENFGNVDGNNIAFTVRARAVLLRDLGTALSPFHSWLYLQGLETLGLRMREHSKNALEVAKYLQSHDKIEWVNYPGLPSAKTHATAAKYFKNGFSGTLGFAIKGGLEEGKKLVNSLKLIKHMSNIADARTILTHPASTTHQQLTKEEREKAGVGDNTFRLSVGLEHSDDIINDLRQALS